MRKIYLFFISLTFVFAANAQVNNNLLAQRLVTNNADSIGLSKNDLGNYIVSSSYYNETGGTQMVYLNQAYKGLPVYNQLLVLAFKNGKLISKAGSFLANMEVLTNGASATAAITPADAVRTSISDAKVSTPAMITVLNTLDNGKKYNFGKLNIAAENVTAELMWVPVDDGKNITAVKLAWQVQLYLDKKVDYLHIRVDANTNKVVNKNSLTVYENFGQPNPVNLPAFMKATYAAQQKIFSNTSAISADEKNVSTAPLSPSLVATANYTVIPYPAESPIHAGGTAAVRTNPWTLAGGNAVTLGWHNDGTVDYTTSRGNNVWAQEDRDQDNTTFGLMATSTTTPDPLNFTYAGQPNYTVDPTTAGFQQFAITNLFYWNNLVHDLTYNYGFTEPAGNFQANNLGRGGAAGADYVIADAQDALDFNNANMSTGADGFRPRMQMFLWDPTRSVTTLNVNSPAAIAGPYNAVEGNVSVNNLLANVGPKTGQVVWYNDDAAGNTHYACGAPVPANSVTGKIALISRGFGGAVCTATVPFTDKIKNAQNNGAIAVIMVNNVPGAPIVMGATVPDPTITIPAVMISDVDGAIFAAQLTNNVNATLSGTAPGTLRIDGDIDNGVIAHEFFHGVSNRLTGGPAVTGCLAGNEQAGEGWSDYMALIITTNWATATVNDGFNIKRPIGNYASGYSINGPGIRPYPYSTNIAVNPLTYNDLPAAVVPHGVGTVFCTALWEMTWQIIQTAGISANVFDANGTGGNVIAFKLVMEGLKLQPCLPGFLDARNAILQADVNLYGGAHTCAIWTAFAKRGMGFSAIQGTSASITDQTPAFNMPPACIATAPNVTINQAAAQADPTSTQPINFTVVFDQVVTGFATGDVVITGTAAAGAVATVTGTGATYNVAVSGMTSCGTIIANIPAGVCQNAAAQPNNASTSTDNTVTYNISSTAPAVTINQAAAQADPTTTQPINFTVVFDQVVTGFATGDVTISGTATGVPVATVSGSGTTYNVAVTGLTGSGTVIATIAAGVAQGGCGQNNVASTSTDNTVTYTQLAPVTVTASAATPGPTPYNTVKLAFDAINAGTHQGAIIVNINGNTDEGATPAVLNSTGTGASVYTSVLVRPTFDGITVTGSATPASRGVIELNGADNVTIDGDNPNTAGTNRNLSVLLTTANGAVGVWLKTASAADGCLNNTIKNTNITGQGTLTTIAGIIAGSGTFGGAAQTGNNNNTIQNNEIKRLQNCLYQNGFATSPFDAGWQIRDNIFGSTVAADKLGFRGMILINASGYLVDNNTIRGISSNPLSTSTMTGIQLATGNLNGTISNNKISDIKQNNTAGWGSNGIWLNGATTNSNTNVFNNFVSDVASIGFNGNTATDNGYGIVASLGSGYNIYYNSVSLNTNQTSATGRPAALLVNGVTAANALNVRDNIFANFQTVGAQRYAVNSIAPATVYADINYNDYYTASGANFGNIGGTDRATLAAWQTGTGKDANSLNAPVQFVSTSDLHLTAGNCLLDGKGTPITIPPITTDIDGAARNAVTPDMGADEFTATPPPTVNAVANQSVCTGATTAAVNFTGTPASGVVYNWVNNAPAIGLAASGTGNIAPFTAVNNTAAAIVATITVTPVIGACPGTPVTFTITVYPNPNLIIVADPGTTLCEGDPTLLTVNNAGAVIPIVVSHSSDNTTIIPLNSVACPTPPNSIWRAYDLSTFPAVTGNFTITAVKFGIEAAVPATQNITVNLYNQTGAAFPGGTRTLIATQVYAVTAAQSGTIFTATLTTPVTVSNASTVAVEVASTTAGGFFIGSNTAAETAPSYIQAAGCGAAAPVTIGSLGFPNMHVIEYLTGTVQTATGIATGTFVWTPAAGLSSTTSNPVAASPMNTTTYTVTRTTVPGGCTASAQITITVNKRPVVTTQPANTVRCAGTTATFTVGATGTGLTYQWQVATSCAGPWTNLANGAPYSGVNTATLTVNPVTGLMSGNVYRVIVTGICAPWTPPTNVSNCATLTVNPNPVVSITPVGPICGGVAGINGVLLNTSASTPPPVPGSVTVNSGTVNLLVPDGVAAGVSTALTIAGVPANATITNISVALNLPHTYPHDMIIGLKGPSGQVLNLYKHNTNTTVFPAASIPTAGWFNAVVSKTASTVFSTVPDPFRYGITAPAGPYKADALNGTTSTGYTIQDQTGFVSNAANFDALYTTPASINNSWTLALCDGGAGDAGTLTNWSITVEYTTPGSGSGPTLTYTWSPLAGLYTDPIATIPYTGTNLPAVYAAPTVQTTYTVRGTDVATGCFTDASVLVNYTPPAPTVVPNPVVMCLGDPAVKLKASSSQSFSSSFNSGALALAIPDGPLTWPTAVFPGVATPNLAVSGIPATATVTGISVKLNLTHTYIGDMVIVLKAPNGNVFNLDANLNRTGVAGANFVNTVINSTSTTPLSAGAAPYSSSFRPDAVGATYTVPGPGGGNTFPGGPTSPAGYIPTVTNFSGLYSVPNGNWTLGIYDWGSGDIGTLNNWSLDIDYTIGVVATPAIWTPAGGLFSDASAGTPYVAGTRVDSVWAKPTPSGVYNYQVTVNNVVTTTATPITPMLGGNTNAVILFNVKNNNTFPVTFSNISSNASVTGAVTSTVYVNNTPIAGPPAAITVANGWNQFGTGASTVTAGVNNLLISGLTLIIPPGASRGIALQMVGAGGPAYTNGTGTVVTYSNGGCDIITDGNVGWAGFAVPAVPGNNPRNFNGSVTFLGTGPGTCQSPARNVTVTVNQPTTVSTQPVNQTICTDKVATFTVAAAGSGPFSYQWQVSTDNGVTWNPVTNGGVYSGATTATLTITAPPVTMSGYRYRAIINGAAPCAAATSGSATLIVNPLPVISITPVSSSVLPGMTVTLTATVTPNPAATFTWIRDGLVLTSSSLGVLSGIGTNTLKVDVDGQGLYSLRVTDVNGCTSTSNSSAVVKDSASGKCFIYPNPNSGKFQVRYYSVAGNSSLPRGIVVYDAKGDRVMIQNYVVGRPYDRMDVDLRQYGKGLYWVEIVDRNGNRLTMCRVAIQ